MEEHSLRAKFLFRGITNGNSNIVDGKEIFGNLIYDRFKAVISTSTFSTTKNSSVIEVEGCFFVDPLTVELVSK